MRKLKAIGVLLAALLILVWFQRNPAGAIVLLGLVGGGVFMWRRRRDGRGSARVCEWCQEKPAEGRARFCSPRCRAQHQLEQRSSRGDELAERRLRVSLRAGAARPDDEIPF